MMNNIQLHVAVPAVPKSTDPMSESMPLESRLFSVHQPMVVLHRATAQHVFREFLSWVLSFCGVAGSRLTALGVPPDLYRHVKRHVLVFAGDANKVNDSMFSQLTKVVHHWHQGSIVLDDGGPVPKDTFTVAFQVRCLIHQVCLTRKTLAMGIESYWSTLVRLGHLFESHTWRQKFYVSIAAIVRENYSYIRVAELPEITGEWKSKNVRELRLFSDTARKSGKIGCLNFTPGLSKRYRALIQILAKDNGDPNSAQFVHFCTGQTCCPNGSEEGLGALVTGYISLFDHMEVPLLYRWKHCSSANDFVRDGFYLHRILPRALEHMPTVKCILSCLGGEGLQVGRVCDLGKF